MKTTVSDDLTSIAGHYLVLLTIYAVIDVYMSHLPRFPQVFYSSYLVAVSFHTFRQFSREEIVFFVCFSVFLPLKFFCFDDTPYFKESCESKVFYKITFA